MNNSCKHATIDLSVVGDRIEQLCHHFAWKALTKLGTGRSGTVILTSR